MSNVLDSSVEKIKFEAWARAEIGMPDSMPFKWHTKWAKAAWNAWLAAKVDVWLDTPEPVGAQGNDKQKGIV